MDTLGKARLEIILSGVELKAPETLEYLNLAMQLIEIRKREIIGPSASIELSQNIPDSPPINLISVPTSAVEDTSKNRTQPMVRARWFLDQFPVITLEDGSFHNPKSTADLKELITSRGLTPHPRGDASMLIWQVRNRLKLLVQPA
ncbi:hypothetical protein FIM02_01785 [SAR202 cluster bacterium AD-802-E10_MRT_200m]|nr:hypothetical protein [SAR202 cluster bacterium AD-802-E10_MRT_200m]